MLILSNYSFRKALREGSQEFWLWLKRLFFNPIFLFVTFWGHIAIFLGAVGFQYYEGERTGAHFLECYYWSISMATTTGSTDLIPATPGGKVTAVFVMISGSLFLWSYAALFAASLVNRRVEKLELDVEEVEREVRIDTRTLERLVRELEVFNRARKEGK